METSILTLSCPDKAGIVAAVASTLAQHGGNILESAQYFDRSTGQFFLRMEFTAPDTSIIATHLQPIAAHYAMHHALASKAEQPAVLVLASTADHCLNALLYQWRTGSLPMKIAAVVANHRHLEAMVTREGLPFHYLPVTSSNRTEQEATIQQLAAKHNVSLLILARYMQVLSHNLCTQFHGRAINIHHSFLPSFKGAKPYHQAHTRGVKIIGATAHYITTDLDEGPIIEQEVARVHHGHTPTQLIEIGRDLESSVLCRAVRLHLERRVLLNGNKTVVLP